MVEESEKIINIWKNISSKLKKKILKIQKILRFPEVKFTFPCMLTGHSLVDRGWGGRAKLTYLHKEYAFKPH